MANSPVGPAIMYMVFAVCFLLLTYLMGHEDSSEIFASSVQRLIDTPWSLNPRLTMLDVNGGLEVYEWLTKVFVNQLYVEYPQAGDRQGYCTEAFKCLLDEGDADSDEQCAGSLKKGTNNCPSYMGTDTDCCEPCVGAGCPNFTVPTQLGGVASTSVQDLSANCAEEMPSWLQELSQWNRESGNLAVATPTRGPDNVVFCPERMSKGETNLDTLTSSKAGRMLMVAQYNRILMGRMTLKRAKLVPHESKAFSNAYPRTVASGVTDCNSYNPSAENEEPFGNDFTYEYQKNKGFNNAGGFVTFIDFDQSKDQVLSEMSKLKRNYWFDLNQGSLVVEMMLFNGNVDRFIYVAFTFQHDFSGQTQAYVNVNPLDLSLHEPSNPMTYVRIFFYVVILMLFCIFVKTEVDDMTANYATYFSNFMLLVHVTSLVLCAICIVQYLMIVFSYAYLNFDFPMAADEQERRSDFEDLVNLANSTGTFMMITSVNTFLILFRCITLMTTLVPQSGVIFNTFGRMKYNLVSFFVIFGIEMFAFTVGSHYLFGSRMQGYSTLTRAFLSSVRMIMREANRAQLVEGDDHFGWIYFMVFHLFFLIVLQILLSALIFGYDQEKKHMSELPEAQRYPLKKMWRSMGSIFRTYFGPCIRCFVNIQQFLFPSLQGGGNIRANFDQVGKLRDRRATKPRVRYVLYEQKQDDETESCDIHKDITLRVVEPFYPKGMVHYYVDSVAQDGPASEFKVVKNTFRLVAIERQGAVDTTRFRSQEELDRYQGDPQKLLETVNATKPVTLIFEGRVPPLSKECGLLTFFIAVFLLFAIMVVRIQDSFSLYVVQERAMIAPQWYQYNPTETKSFDSMDSVADLEHWIRAAILEREYACVTSIDRPEECSVSDLTDKERRGWVGWAGPSRELPGDSRGTPLQAAEPAAEGLSLGYIPFVQPMSRATSSQVRQTVREHEYNLGVMPNNHVRLTLQVACFQENENKRWIAGYPWRLDPVLLNSDGCAKDSCMQQMVENSLTCFTSQGDRRSTQVKKGSGTGVQYVYAKEGTYNNLGGVAIGLGNTRKEAERILHILEEDEIFRANAVSFVFEFVTYNANFDLFTYTSVMFSLKKTGKFDHEVVTSSFPLNVFSMGAKGGHKESWVILNRVSFAFYIIATALQIAHLVWDLSVQYCITVALNRSWYYFFLDFFLEDWWNVVDLVSIVLNLMVIDSVFRFMLIDGKVEFSASGVQSWTRDYVFSTSANLDTVDPMQQFAQAAEVYNWFSGLTGANGLFLMLRFAKYFSGLSALRLIMTAISSAMNELIIMTVTFLIMMLSFVFMFFTRYGVQYARFGSLPSTFVEIFLFLNGRFDMEDLVHNNSLYTTAVFTVCEVVFLLILNMFLAAIVYRWKDTRRDAQEVSLLGAWQKLKEPCSMSMLSSWEKNKEQDQTLVKLDTEFWQRLSVLRYLANLDENGRIIISKAAQEAAATPLEGNKRRRDGEDNRRNPDRGEDGSDSEGESQQDNLGGFDFENPEDHKRFIKVFKKAHMEIASQMCRAVALPKSDEGAGVGELEAEEERANAEAAEADAQRMEDDALQIHMIGIIEEPQSDQTVDQITNRLTQKLEESEHPAEEIWLDALLTVLEEAKGLNKLQRFFMPLPTIQPTKPQEIGNWNQKKVKMERRLNLFLRWLQEEARCKHYRFLKVMAEQKENNLKQQSLVLTDYLDTLDQQIVKLEEEIKVLERKNARMRSHVSPLL